MSQTSKIVLGIAIAAVALLGGFYYWHVMQRTGPEGQETSEETTSLPSGQKSDDASIEQDLSAVDTQMQGVQSDNADVGASVSAAAAQ